MTAPTLIFGGLLAAAIAICGAMDASTPAAQQQALEESRLIYNESVIGFSPNDPVASCGHERGQGGKRCRERSTSRSSSSGFVPASFAR